MRTRQLRLIDDLEEPDFVNPVVFRVLARDVRGAIAAFVAFSVTGLLAAAFWGAVALSAFAPRPELARRAPAALAALVLIGSALAAARHLRLRSSCSDPACEGAPGPHDLLCPSCGAEIVGTVSRATDRLAARGWYGVRLVRPELGPGGRRVLH